MLMVWQTLSPSKRKAAERAASCHPFSAVPLAQAGEAKAAQQKGALTGGTEPAETSTEPQLKFIMWNTSTARDTEKE